MTDFLPLLHTAAIAVTGAVLCASLLWGGFVRVNRLCDALADRRRAEQSVFEARKRRAVSRMEEW